MYFNRDVTIFKKVGDGCEKQIIHGVFYDDSRAIGTETKGRAESYMIKAVIPISNLPIDYCLYEGDYLCKGAIEADYETISDMRRAEQYYMIQSVSAKDYGSVPNVLVLGR